ncbi:hypothetical protein ACWCQS_22395 [Streptomyces sp. NPDC002076]
MMQALPPSRRVCLGELWQDLLKLADAPVQGPEAPCVEVTTVVQPRVHAPGEVGIEHHKVDAGQLSAVQPGGPRLTPEFLPQAGHHDFGLISCVHGTDHRAAVSGVSRGLGQRRQQISAAGDADEGEEVLGLARSGQASGMARP